MPDGKPKVLVVVEGERLDVILSRHLLKVLEAQLALLQNEAHVAVLSTCAFFIPEYNPRLMR